MEIVKREASVAIVILSLAVARVQAEEEDAILNQRSETTDATQFEDIRKRSCDLLPGLTEKQRRWCRVNYVFLEPIATGSKLALDECGRRFKNRRWNCPTKHPDIFSKIYNQASPETAFVHSAQSAGVTLAISRTCSNGGAPGWCGCDDTWTRRPAVNFTWGTCSDNYVRGYEYGKQFMDAKEDGLSAESLATLHNYEAGRLAVRNRMRLQCKCHGLTGTCAHKTCWYSLPVVQVVGKLLMSLYEESSPVLYDSKSRRLAPAASVFRIPTPEDLVHVRRSPSYCLPDFAKGSLGTHGRQCDSKSIGPGGCDFLCCGRGYNVRRRIETTKCKCKFIWCCRVECQQCRTITETHTCI